MSRLIKPFVKWAGGKSRLISEIKKRLPEKFNTYYEPFLGGGAVAFSILPVKAVLNDKNHELINLYRNVRDNFNLFMSSFNHRLDENYYYALRDIDKTQAYDEMDEILKASRFLYLNRTCFAGVSRWNSSGHFNAAWGNYESLGIEANAIREARNYLRKPGISILNVDFEEAVSGAKLGDFIYFDPPYAPVVPGGFAQYTKDKFPATEQIRLKKLCDRLTARGVKWLLSNSDTEFINELYSGYTIEKIGVLRNITVKSNINELLIRNY